MTTPLTVLTLLKLNPSPNGHLHGERPFWREMGRRYLDAWLAGVRRWVPEPKRIVVMTDETITLHIPPVVRGTIDIRVALLDPIIDAPGFWSKLNMFRPEVSTGLTLWSDLDNVFCGDLSELVHLTPDPLMMTDDRHIPGLPNGSTMLFDADRCHAIWDAYACDPRWIEREYVVNGSDYSRAFDQAFIADWVRITTGAEPALFQEQLPLGYMVNAYSELPRSEDWREARIIFGCGPAKPHRSIHQVFREHWVTT